MERYEGKPRFVVVTVGGQRGYAVFRLDGRWNHSDERLTPVYNKIRARREAGKIAAHLTENPLQPVNTRHHIPESPAGKSTEESAEFQHHLTSEQVAKILQVSTDTVFRLFEGKAGVLDFGFPERRNKRIRRMLRIPPSAVRLIQAQFQSKARQ